MIKLYLSIGAVLAGFAFGWAANGWRLNAHFESEKLEAAKATLRLADSLALANDENLKKLKDAQNETSRLRAGVGSGAIGLRINATCPESTAPGAGVDPAAGAELAGNARQSYFALRDGIDQASAQLMACQSELTLRAAVGRGRVNLD